jgi:hypothetical protein
MVHPGSQKRLGLFYPKIDYGKSYPMIYVEYVPK